LAYGKLVNQFRGRSYLAAKLDNMEHPAAGLLCKWRDNGVPAQTADEPWSLSERDSCVKRGCHQSATKQAPFLDEEMAKFINSHFWTVLPYRLVWDLPELQS
jgi:hypothetical protein